MINKSENQSKSDLFIYSTWYNNIRPHCIKSRIVQFTQSIEDFFKADSIIYPDLEENLATKDKKLKEFLDQTFEEFEYVFPKVNTVSPSDASFFIQELKCISTEDVFTALKASTRISDELNKSKNNELVLKKWYSLKKIDEFRLFILENDLVGISQRYINMVYDAENCEEIKELINEFFCKIDWGKKMADYDTCTIDVIVYPQSKRVKIVDVNRLEDNQDSCLLFNTVENLRNTIELEIRVVDSIESKRRDVNRNEYPLELDLYGNIDIEKLVSKANEEDEET